MKLRQPRIFDFEFFREYTNAPYKVESFIISKLKGIDFKDHFLENNLFVITLCEKGFYRASIDQKSYQLNPGQLMFVKPLEIHTQIDYNHYEGYIIIFTKDFLLESGLLLESLLNDFKYFESPALNIIDLNSAEFKRLKKTLEGISNLYNQLPPPNRRLIMYHSLMGFLLDLKTIFDEMGKEAQTLKGTFLKKKIYGKFLKLLNLHYRNQKEVSFYSDKLSITSGYLSEVTREVSGKSAKNLIIERILYDAKYLLRSTSHSISEIANLLDYKNDSTFTRLFKEKTGQLPSAYRKG